MITPITEETRVWWHGCWDRSGHNLFEPGGNHGVFQSNTPRSTDYGVCPFPWFSNRLDGGYAPMRIRPRSLRFESGSLRDLCSGFQDISSIVFVCMVDKEDDRVTLMHKAEECAQGEFLRHFVNGCTLLAWWDRTHGDTRVRCNSVVIAEGEHDSIDMQVWFRKRFPLQARHLADAGVGLVEVFA